MNTFLYKIREEPGYSSIDVTLAHFIQHPFSEGGESVKYIVCILVIVPYGLPDFSVTGLSEYLIMIITS